MAGTGGNDACVRPRAKPVAEVQRVAERCRRVQRAAVRRDTHEGTQDELGYGIGTHVRDGPLQQITRKLVIGLLDAMGVEQHVDIEQDHPALSRISASAALLFRSTPGTGAVPRKIGTW